MGTLDFRPLLLAIGTLLTILAVAMLVPALIDLVNHNPDWITFTISAFLTAFIGVTLVLTNESKRGADLSLKQAFLLTTTSWFVVCAFGAIPFYFSDLHISYTDAFFETMSGLTTTGATVLVGLDNMPPGILMWRALLQGLGGIGIIVMAMAILPMLRIGGMQLFRTESSDKSDKVMPRVAQVSIAIISVYILLNVMCTISLWMAGMSVFDAICHAMATIATGGLSTKDASIGYYNSPLIEYIISFFMVMGSLPFVLYVEALRGNMKALFRDSQVQWFLSLVGLTIAAVTIWQICINHMMFFSALRYSSFNLISIVSTTGFVSIDYSTWGGFAVIIFFLLSVIGGCTGSTAGGVKVFRYQILYQTAQAQIAKLIQPHAIIKPRFNGQTISDSIASSVMGFVVLYALCFQVVAILLTMTGLDFVTSMSASAAALGNVGPGLGPIVGPAGNYGGISTFAKWTLSAAMLLGRLEIYTILVLFTRRFWQD